MPQLIRPLFLSVLCVCAGLQPAWSQAPVVAQIPSQMDVYDGFEDATLSKLWETDRFAPGAVVMQRVIVRSGRGAAKITVQSGEVFEAGVNGNKDSERAELQEARKFTSKEAAGYEYSFSMFLPADFPVVPVRLVLAQWKQYCPEGGACFDDSPVLALRYVDGVLRITQTLERKDTVLYEHRGEIRNAWLDFKFRIRFSHLDDGRVAVWIGDKQVVNFTGITANNENPATGYPGPGYFYFKMGLYRDGMKEPMTSYVDEYRKHSLPQGAW